MSSFCSISLTLWSPSSLFHIQKWSQNCLFHKPVPLSNKALPPRKCCPHLSIKFLYSVLSICRVLVLPEDITSHRTDQEGSWVSKATLLSLSLSFTVYSVISSTHYWTSRLDPDITFSLRPPEQITCWAGTWSPPFLGSLNIYWAIVLASRLPFFFFFLLASALSFSPLLSNSQPNLPLSNDDPMMTTHRWKTHTWEGIHFYGENIPELERNCSRREQGWWYSNFRVALSVCNWQLGVGVGVLLHIVRTGCFLKKFQAALLIIGAG